MPHRIRLVAVLAVLTTAVLVWAGVVAVERQTLLKRIAVLESLTAELDVPLHEATAAARWIGARRATEGIPALQHALAVTRYLELKEAALAALLQLGPAARVAAERYLLERVRAANGGVSGWALEELSRLGRESKVSTRELCAVLSCCEKDSSEEASRAMLMARGQGVVGEVAASCAAMRFERWTPFLAVLLGHRDEAPRWIDGRLQDALSPKERQALRGMREELLPAELPAPAGGK